VSDVRGTRREVSYNQDSERHVMEVSGNGGIFFFIGLHKGYLRHLVQGGGGAWPICSFDRNLHLMYCYVMNNLDVCGLIFYHNTLRDILLWARAS